MLNAALIAARVTVFTLLLTGVAYPLLVTGLAQLLFPHQANGSLVQDDQGRVVGSALDRPAVLPPGLFPAPAFRRGETRV